MMTLLAVTWLSFAFLSEETPPEKPTPPTEKSDSGIAEARETLKAVAEKHGKLETLKASYTQKRSTPLMKKPLVSRGEFFFRKKPGCILFRTTGKRGTVIRIDDKHYEVYRPRRKKLERFVITNQAWSQALFETFSQRVDELEKHFIILSSELVDQKRQIHLKPRPKPDPSKPGSKKDKDAAIQALSITIDTEQHLLTRIAYSDADGDQVAISLSEIQLNPTLPPPTFTLDTAPGTKIIVHP